MVCACSVGSAIWIASAAYLAAFVEPAELSKAHYRVSAAKDRWQHGHTEIFGDPAGRQRREIVRSDLEDVAVLSAEIVRLLEVAGGNDAKPQIAEALGNLQGAGTGRKCLVQLVER